MYLSMRENFEFTLFKTKICKKLFLLRKGNEKNNSFNIFYRLHCVYYQFNILQDISRVVHVNNSWRGPIICLEKQGLPSSIKYGAPWCDVRLVGQNLMFLINTVEMRLSSCEIRLKTAENCSIFLFYERKGEIRYQGQKARNNSSSKEADTLNFIQCLTSFPCMITN
jgi:hypothetical protein